MNEVDWNTCDTLGDMLHFLQGKASDRKCRLFACASYRSLEGGYADRGEITPVSVAETYADGLIDETMLDAVCRTACDAYHSAASGDPSCDLAGKLHKASVLCYRSGYIAAVNFAESLGKEKSLCLLLRHIIGNPLRPYPAPLSWPSTVVQLAESLYAGQDCAFALHDALLEAGHGELAEHFREEKSHPKGCWVVDLILGKE
jgi:hypothetical protein